MTSESGNAGEGRPDDDPDLGESIAELQDVSWPLEDRFTDRVRGRIERRVLAGDVLEMFWTAPLTMLFEFLQWPFDRFTGRRK